MLNLNVTKTSDVSNEYVCLSELTWFVSVSRALPVSLFYCEPLCLSLSPSLSFYLYMSFFDVFCFLYTRSRGKSMLAVVFCRIIFHIQAML